MTRRTIPSNAGTPLVKPPCLTYGVTPVTSSSSSAAAVAGAALAALDGARHPALVLSLANALQSSGLLGDLRDAGVQTLVSPSAGANVIALDSERIVLAIGDSMIESARHASLRLDTAPASGALTDLWSANLIAFRGEQYASLVRRRRRRHVTAWCHDARGSTASSLQPVRVIARGRRS